MLRTMQKARYAPENLGHFGLAAASYTHFTSPIRRYPDLVVHRALRATRHRQLNEESREEWAEELPEMARHTSEMERRADDAERELLQWKKVKFMADKVGDEFDGYVTGVAAFGLFVQLIEHYVEGLVHVSTMADDYYRFVDGAHLLRGENTQKVYRLGDKVNVQVIRVNMDVRQIDLGLVEILERVRAGERGARRSSARPKTEQRRKQRPGKRERDTRKRGPGVRVLSVMKSVVVGTAGHIDHGKSALVHALTGTDPDRLKEEKARGITIDLGFAHLVGDDVNFAFVDVPGHERFVKNMLAGVGGIDLVLLVVAADESVMPQTREHFEICRLLRVPSGIIALTKSDLVDRDMLDLVRLEVRELVAGSFLAAAPILPVSARTGHGLDDLRAALAAAGSAVRGRSSAGAARLPIDRVFSMKDSGPS